MDLLYPRAFLAHFTEERRESMARIDSAYDYYVSTYGSQKNVTLRCSQRAILEKYNNIVKTNKESPYKISNLDEPNDMPSI